MPTQTPTTHAPGPWNRRCVMNVIADPYVLIEDGTVDARGIEALIALVKGDDPDCPNARLIVAAPDMRSALEALVEALERPVTAGGMETYAAEAYGLDDEYSRAVEALRIARQEVSS